MRYKKGDKVKVKSVYDIVSALRQGYVGLAYFYEGMYNYCEREVTIHDVSNNLYTILEDNCVYCWAEEMFEGLVETNTNLHSQEKMEEPTKEHNNTPVTVTSNTVYTCKLKQEDTKSELEVKLAEGYEFQDEKGNIIPTTKIFMKKIKQRYPRTYEECVETLNIVGNELQIDATNITTYEIKATHIICKFYKLLICRDAYWKLANEWEPDWFNRNEPKYYISTEYNEIKQSFCGSLNKVLCFPTEEMRDAFYNNFQKDIEQCKSLL